jgi:nicotinamidase/pyrazinamidase
LKREGAHRLFVGGLALDGCVLASVIDARKAGFDVQVIRDATRAIKENAGRQDLLNQKIRGRDCENRNDGSGNRNLSKGTGMGGACKI